MQFLFILCLLPLFGIYIVTALYNDRPSLSNGIKGLIGIGIISTMLYFPSFLAYGFNNFSFQLMGNDIQQVSFFQIVMKKRYIIMFLPILFFFLSMFIGRLVKNAKHILLISLTVLLLLSANSIKSMQVFDREIIDNPEVAKYLHQMLQAGDKIIAVLPLDYPLEYYLRELEVDIDFPRGEKSGKKRFILIVNSHTGPDLPTMIENELSGFLYLSKPILLKSFNYTDLFEVKTEEPAGITVSP